MRRATQYRGLHRVYLAILGGATLVALIGAAFAADARRYIVGGDIGRTEQHRGAPDHG